MFNILPRQEITLFLFPISGLAGRNLSGINNTESGCGCALVHGIGIILNACGWRVAGFWVTGWVKVASLSAALTRMWVAVPSAVVLV